MCLPCDELATSPGSNLLLAQCQKGLARLLVSLQRDEIYSEKKPTPFTSSVIVSQQGYPPLAECQHKGGQRYTDMTNCERGEGEGIFSLTHSLKQCAI